MDVMFSLRDVMKLKLVGVCLQTVPVPLKTFNDFDLLRKKLGNYINAAKNQTDKATAISIKQEYKTG